MNMTLTPRPDSRPIVATEAPGKPSRGQLRRIDDLPDLMTRPEVAEFTGIAVQTLARWAVEDTGPKITRLGTRAVRYRKADVLSFIESGAA